MGDEMNERKITKADLDSDNFLKLGIIVENKVV
jgi:hypothetical protein